MFFSSAFTSFLNRDLNTTCKVQISVPCTEIQIQVQVQIQYPDEGKWKSESVYFSKVIGNLANWKTKRRAEK